MANSQRNCMSILDGIWEDILNTPDQIRLLLERAKIECDNPPEKSENEVQYKNVIDAYILVKEDKYIEALKLVMPMYEHFKAAEFYEGLLRTLRVLCLVYARLGRMEDCINTAKEGLELIKTKHLNLTEGGGVPVEFNFLNNIATMYAYLDRNAEAIEHYKNALEILPSKALRPWLVAETNRGAAYVEIGEYDKGFELLGNCLKVLENNNLEAHYIQMIHHGMGRAYKKVGRISEGIYEYKIALDVAEENNEAFDQLDILIDLIRIKLDAGLIDGAQKYIDRAVELATSMEAFNFLYQVYELKAQYYEIRNEPAEALSSYKKYIEIRQFVASKETEMLMSVFTVEKQVEKTKKDAEILALRTQSLEKAHRDLSTLSDIGKDITASLSMDILTQKTYENLNELMDLSYFSIAIYNSVDSSLDYIAYIEDGIPRNRFTVNIGELDTLEGKCIELQDTVTIQSENELYGAVICHPLILGNKVTGIIKVQSNSKLAYGDNEVEVIKILGTYVVIALNNSKKSEALEAAIDKLEVLSNVDSLTGLFNRRYIIEKLEYENQRFLRYKHFYSVLIIDVDHFKNINDTYGHEMGDYALCEITKVMCSMIRKQDTLSRWGGEEFLLLASETPIEQAYDLAERIRQKISEHVISKDTHRIMLSVTIGIAVSSAEMTITELINSADGALYEGKKSGRNCTVKSTN